MPATAAWSTLDRVATPTITLLLAASLASGVSLSLFDRNVRPEHLAAAAAIAVIVAGALVTRRVPWTVNRFTGLAAAWLAANAASSLLFSPQPWESAVHVLRIALLVATFAVVAYLPRPTPDEWLRLLRLWLWLAAAQAAYGLITWVVAGRWDIWLPGARIVPGIPGISIEGTMYERNLFGILAGTATIVALHLLLCATGRERAMAASRPALFVVFVLCGGALVMALTRSAWVAAILVAPIAFALARWRHDARPGLPLILAMFAVPVGFAVLTAIAPAPAPSAASAERTPPPAREEPSSTTAFSERVATMTPARVANDRTVRTRLDDARMAFEDFTASPVFGHGTGSFVMLRGIRAGSPAWISNMPLHTLVDTGLVGLAAQLGLVLTIVVGGWRASVTTRDARLAAGLQAMLLGLLVIGIGYQVTDGSWLAVYWIHLGLIVYGITCVDRERHGSDVPV